MTDRGDGERIIESVTATVVNDAYREIAQEALETALMQEVVRTNQERERGDAQFVQAASRQHGSAQAPDTMIQVSPHPGVTMIMSRSQWDSMRWDRILLQRRLNDSNGTANPALSQAYHDMMQSPEDIVPMDMEMPLAVEATQQRHCD